MIDIKVIKKPKNEGSTSALRTSGTAYGGMAVKEAAHAAKADIAELAKEAIHAKDSDHAIEADHSKEADHAVNADESKHALEADHAKEADNADKWDYREFDDYLNQPVRKTDGVTFDSVTSDSIRSAGQFVDGMLGAGFHLWKGEDGRTYLTVDKLTVRQTMAVMELLIEKVRSVGGQICVSAANGRIKTVEESDEHYLITFEQENMFVQHDLVRCQTFTGKDMRSYWVEVTDVTETGIVVGKEEFEGVEPKEGDECVLMGNTANTDRQNMVLISATEDGQPRVDVMDGVNGKTFANCLRARLGNLDGIKDDKFPADRQPKGNGLYADNAFLKGTFVLETGEDVKTRFEITEGKVQSAIDSVRNDFLSEKGYLNNSTFASGLEKWNSENETVFFLVGNRWIWANGAALSKKGDGASVVTDMGRKVVRIRNKYIRQKHENLRFVPTFPTNSDGKKEALPVYLSFFYRCAKSGTLKIGFENVDKTGFADFNSMEVSEEIAATGGYVQYTCSGLWNGTGDFKLAFDGDIYLYMLVLSTDKIEALTYKYKTLFEQSERLVKISAAVYDKDERALEETGLIVTSKVSGLYAIDVDGNLKSFVGAGQDGVKIKASNIQLEGLVTANENFKILEDGSIEAKNGKFTGEINASNGNIGNLVISSDNLHYGNIDDWTTEEQKTLISASQIRLQNYLYDENTAKWTFHQLFLGINADPNDDDAATFMYLNKNMQQGKDIASLFRPAFRIESKVASSPRVSILSSGSIVVNEGGVLQAGKIKDVSAELPLVQIYSIDWMDGPLQLLKNTSGSNRTVFLDIKNDLLYWMFGSSTYDYAFVLTLVGHKSNNADIDIASGGIALIGASKITIKANSVVKLLIVRNGNSAPYEDNFYCLYNNNL
ncbi:hypothetical protein [Prevotella merdae]|uniref:hypothetical protein n=1 Tax=Prevotella merdae TaxID=2079531 RepID=UPI003F80776B